jgi:hypothetical protein
MVKQSGAQGTVAITGSSGNNAAPSFPSFLSRLFDQKNGAFQVLGGTLGGTGGGVSLDVGVVDVTKVEPSTVLDWEGITVTALGIPHGNIPALASVYKRAMCRSYSARIRPEPTQGSSSSRRARMSWVMHFATAASDNPFHASRSSVASPETRALSD